MQEEMWRRTREAPKVPGTLFKESKIVKEVCSEEVEHRPWWETCRTNPGISLHADGVSYQAYYSEVGKAHHMGKDLTEVRSLQRKLVPDNVGLGQYEQTSLRGIATKAKACARHRFQDLPAIGIRTYVKIKAAATGYFWRRRHVKESKLLLAMSAREYRAMAIA
jgi:hypothetical protein